MEQSKSRKYRAAAMLGGALIGMVCAQVQRATAQEGAAPTAPVTVLNAQTWETAKGLLPDELLERYKNGDWSHEIRQPPASTHLADDDFIAAGPKNAGRFAVGPDGGIIEIATGKQPAFIYGPPFPTVDANDPQAGTKLVWNYFYQSFLLGDSRNYVNLDWVGARGAERHMANDVTQRFFDGQPTKYQPKDNPQNFLFQQVANVNKPADLQGTVSLTHRFRDPTKRDQVWSYVPAMRRVRAVSPVNRSDGFLGSDICQDDGSYFDGKPEDFTWRLVGEGDVLMLYDRASTIDGVQHLRQLPEGGDESTDSLRPRFAYQLPGWSGQAWAPLSSEYVLIKRPVWIVEGKPKDRYYLYGKIVLRFDKESWRGTYNSKYDWKGSILMSYMTAYGPYFRIGQEWRQHSEAFFTMSQNLKMNRATVGFADPEHPHFQARLSLPDALFSVDALTRTGK